MKRSSTLFLKAVLILMATVVTAFLAWFPQVEGRAANLDLIGIYSDPFILYIYVASIPFFVALFQAFKMLTYIEQNNAFSVKGVKALKNIKYCAAALALFMAGAMSWIYPFADDEDAPGVILLALIVMFAIIVIATAAGVFQKLLQNAVDLKSENDLTV